jgi:hypothetical protein
VHKLVKNESYIFNFLWDFAQSFAWFHSLVEAADSAASVGLTLALLLPNCNWLKQFGSYSKTVMKATELQRMEFQFRETSMPDGEMENGLHSQTQALFICNGFPVKTRIERRTA